MSNDGEIHLRYEGARVLGQNPLASAVFSQSDEDLAGIASAASNDTRIAILRHLLRQPATSTQLAEALGRDQGRVSHHLACLTTCGLTRKQRDGQAVFYGLIDPRTVKALVESMVRILEIGQGNPAMCWPMRVEFPENED